MIKDCIGRCRATSYDLPKDVMHVYGYIQEKAKAGHKPDRHNKPPFDGPYGFVPKTGTEPLTHTIEGRYMGQGDDDADYPDIISIKKANKLPGPKPTKASQGHAVKAKEES